jgi:hypothetical protein
MPRPFEPKPLTSGARVTWRHFHTDRTDIARSGTVWDRGPSVSGATVVVWVIPDEHLDSDPYCAVPVGRARRGGYVAKGEMYSTDFERSPLGALALAANESAETIRKARTD